MNGTWAAHKEALTSTYSGLWPARKRVISKELLQALDYVTKIKMLYDPETPLAVVMTLKKDKDNSVCMAAHQRPKVLAGELKNPFED
jgi:hypothetical protein